MLAKLRKRAAALTHSLNVVQRPLLRRARRRTKANHNRALERERQARRLRREAREALAAGEKAKAKRKLLKAHRKEEAAIRFHRRAHAWANRVRVLAARIAGIEGKLAEVNEKIDALPKDQAAKKVKELVGVKEQPPGSNWGGMVERMIRFTGYTFPVYWCGCFACWVTCKIRGINIPNRIRMGYAPYITEDALKGRNGFKAVSVEKAKRWDVGCLWGGKHIVVIWEAPKNGLVKTIEGNTSGGAGSQSNGGEVAFKVRSIADFDRGIVARPVGA